MFALGTFTCYDVDMKLVDRAMRIEALDPTALSAAECKAALREIRVATGSINRIEGAITRRLGELHADGQAAPPADAIGMGGTVSRRAAEQTERRGETLGHTPRLDDALGKGKIGNEHVDALANAAGRLDDGQRTELFSRDDEITELAASATPESFRRRLNKIINSITDDDGLDRAAKQAHDATVATGIDDDSGMHWLRANLTPEHGNRIRRNLDAEIAALSKLDEHRGVRRDQIAAIALDRLVSGERTSQQLGVAEAMVIIDHRSLIDGVHASTVAEYSDGSPIPVEHIRRVACDAKIIPVVLGGDGVPLDVGRARRLATPAQRAALRSMYRTCAIDGCDHHFDRCHLHHLLEWEADLGPTDLDNLLPLCSFHHHRAHEGRWRLQLDPSSRQLTVHLDNGTYHSQAWPDMIDDRRAA